MHSSAYYYMPVFKPGAVVVWKNNQEKVNYVVIRRHAMAIYLAGREAPVKPEELNVKMTAFHTTRVPNHLDRRF